MRNLLGCHGAGLGKRVDSSAGWSSGYQMFFPGILRQVIMNFGGRKDTNNTNRIVLKERWLLMLAINLQKASM